MVVSTNIRLLRPLGEGGMGAVWVAEHMSLHTHVVVKFMSQDLVDSPEAKARFAREAAAASQVKSPHVVQTFDHGLTPEGVPYIVMELLEGRDLEHYLRAKAPDALSPREVVAVVAQLARALSKAHERGIVHRDIKPSNVFLCDAGGGELFVKLLDFGIAKGGEMSIAGSTTRTGSFIGSPFYMSPEQVVGAKDIDFRSDLWSLAVVAFEALTGQKPFHAETVGALALKIHRDPLPIPTSVNPQLPPAVDKWFEKACCREAAGRFASAKEMADALAQASMGEGVAVGVNIDRVPAPLAGAAALAETEQATIPENVSSGGVDARSETGAGVGLASQRLPLQSRGRVFAIAGTVAAAAIGLVLVTKLVSSPTPPPSPSTAVANVVALPPPANPPTVSLPPLPSAVPAPTDAPSASVVASNHPPPPPVIGNGGAPHGKPHASAAASAPTPPPTPTPTVVKPSAGSDDDIK
jgi:serine/threonine-protein kinase